MILNLRKRWILRSFVLAALITAPFVLNTFRLGLLAEILIFGLAAASLSLLVGAGLPSLGHAAYFGLGGYAAGLASVHMTNSAWIGLLIAAGTGAVFALPCGWVSVRLTGMTFLMLSLAIAEIVFSVSQSWRSLTGGSDGLAGVGNVEVLPGLPLTSIPQRYYYVLAVFVVLYLALRRFVDSPVGWTLRGIHSNPERMSSMGYNVRMYRLLAYMVASVVGAIAGALDVQYARFVSPDNLDFIVSALLLVMVLLGGSRHLHGALIGAGVLVVLRQELSSAFDSWEMGLGIILVLVIYLLPGGLAEIGARSSNLFKRSRTKEIVDTTRRHGVDN